MLPRRYLGNVGRDIDLLDAIVIRKMLAAVVPRETDPQRI